MNYNYSQYIKNKLDELDYATSFSSLDISNQLAKQYNISIEGSKKITNNTLKRMCDKQVIKRSAKGLYYKPKTTIFGELKPTNDQIDSYCLTIQNNEIIGYTSGDYFYHEIGLTSLMPKEKLIKTNKPRKKILSHNIKAKKAITQINYNNYLYLQILDAISNLDFAFIDADNPKFIINYHIKNKNLDLIKLLALSKRYYSDKTTIALVEILVEGENEFTQ